MEVAKEEETMTIETENDGDDVLVEGIIKSVVSELHQNYRNVHQKVYVRVANLPMTRFEI